MKNTQIVQTIATLSTAERRKFSEFVQSPYFNKNERVQQFIQIILATAPQFLTKKLDKVVVFRQLFGEVTMEIQQLRDVASQSMKLLEKFMAIEQFQQKYNTVIGAGEYAKRGDLTYFLERNIRKATRQLEKTPTRDAVYFQELAQLYSLKEYSASHNRQTDFPIFLQQKTDAQDIAFILRKFKNACDMLGHQLIMNSQFELRLVADLQQVIMDSSSYYHQFPVLIFYYELLQLLSHPQHEPQFNKLEILLPKTLPFVTSAEGQEMFTYLKNYCIWQINQANSAYHEKLFSLFQQQTESQLLLHNGQLSQWTYVNIISVGCRLKRFDWIERFINDYKDVLPDQHRDNAYTYNLAFFYLQKEEWDRALTLLQDVEFTDVYYQLNARIFLIKIHFAQANWRTLEYTLDSFRIYLLRNKKLSKSRCQAGNKFIRFTQKLFKIYADDGLLSKREQAENYAQLHQEILNEKNTLQKGWLLEQIRKK